MPLAPAGTRPEPAVSVPSARSAMPLEHRADVALDITS